MEQRIEHLFSPNISQAICHTLVHSLWQGILLVMLTGAIVLLTKRSSAVTRYRLLTGTLFLFTAAFIFTLIFELLSPAESYSIHLKANALPGIWTYPAFALKYAHEQAGIIVAIWLSIVALQSGRLLFGLYIIKRLKSVKVSKVSAFWDARVKQLGADLKIKKAVLLLESGIAKIPLVIGYLKPVILIPVGLVNSMEQREVEAILLHELAHISRNDYLVNLLQSIMETLLFFNPAVLWLSHLIKTERENCCDDMVLTQTNNKISYIQALVHFQEYNVNTPKHAFAIGGKSTAMLRRLQRMVSNRNRGLNYSEIICLAVLMALSVLFIATGPTNNIRSIISTHQSAAPHNKSTAKAFEAKKQAEKAAAQRTRKPGNSP